VLFKHQGWSEQSEESSIIAWEGVSTLNLRQR
jgi:hypothetical protein